MHKHHLLHLTNHYLLKPQHLLRHDLLLDQTLQLSEALQQQETIEILVGGNAHVSGSTNTAGILKPPPWRK